MLPDFPGGFLGACARADTAARLLSRFGQPRPSLDEELDQYALLRRMAPAEVGRDFLQLAPWSAPVARVLDDIREIVAP
jgi:hypothetical protein